MENKKKGPTEKDDRPGAAVGDMSVVDDVDQDSFYRSVNMVLAGL